MTLDELPEQDFCLVARRIEATLPVGGYLYLSMNPFLDENQIRSLRNIKSMTKDLRISYLKDKDIVSKFPNMSVKKFWNLGVGGRAWFLHKGPILKHPQKN